jgi:hypothetical protein
MIVYKTEKNKGYADELKYHHIGAGISEVIFIRKGTNGKTLYQGHEQLMLNIPKLSKGDKGLLLAFFNEYQEFANAPKEPDFRKDFEEVKWI